MTLAGADVIMHSGGEESKGSYLATSIQPHSPRFEKWIEARHNFMLERGWVTGPEDDFDGYDLDQQTEHLGVYEGDQLVYGMRLTPVDGFEQSLSWNMVENSSIQQQIQEKAFLNSTHQVWDLTRLVPGEAASIRASYSAIPKLFGEGLRHCITEGDENPLWIFVLDEGMKKWLLRQGVDITILGEGQVNGDTVNSSFGYFEPAKLAALQDVHPFAKQAMAGED